jgi:hypothetical protein
MTLMFCVGTVVRGWPLANILMESIGNSYLSSSWEDFFTKQYISDSLLGKKK